MGLIINFAGSDKSGKTEIAKELSRRLGIPYFKNQQEIVNFKDDEDYFRKVLKYGCPLVIDLLGQMQASVIFDRNYACEWVYSRAMNRVTYPDILRRIDDAYAKLNSVTIICTRSNYDNIIDDAFPDLLHSEKLTIHNRKRNCF